MGPDQPSLLNRTRERFLRNIFRRKGPANQVELAKVIEQASQDEVINEDTEDMIRGVFDLAKRRVSDVMIPRSSIIAIDSNATIAQAIEVVKQYGHSRYPVSFEDKDHILGTLMAKDLLPLAQDASTKKLSDFPDLLRKPVIVPESKRVDMMLKEFQKDRFHMAIVIDEYGGVCGLITIEDIIELIVGEISDEYEADEANLENITQNSPNVYMIRGSTPLEEFAEYFKTSVPAIDVDTVAGLVIHSLGHLPRKDETVMINQFTFKVINNNKRKVQMLQLTVNPNYNQ